MVVVRVCATHGTTSAPRASWTEYATQSQLTRHTPAFVLFCVARPLHNTTQPLLAKG